MAGEIQGGRPTDSGDGPRNGPRHAGGPLGENPGQERRYADESMDTPSGRSRDVSPREGGAEDTTARIPRPDRLVEMREVPRSPEPSTAKSETAEPRQQEPASSIIGRLSGEYASSATVAREASTGDPTDEIVFRRDERDTSGDPTNAFPQVEVSKTIENGKENVDERTTTVEDPSGDLAHYQKGEDTDEEGK